MAGNRFFGRPVTATTSTSGTIINALFTNPEFAARPKLPLSSTNVSVTTGFSYFGYVGLWPAGAVFQKWESQLTTTASNEQAEFGVFVSPLPPNRQAQTLYRIATATAHDAFSSTGVKRNTDALNATLYTDSFVWAGFHRGSAGTPGAWQSIALDLGEGYAMVTPSSIALTATDSFLATLYTGGVPYMALSLLV